MIAVKLSPGISRKVLILGIAFIISGVAGIIVGRLSNYSNYICIVGGIVMLVYSRILNRWVYVLIDIASGSMRIRESALRELRVPLGEIKNCRMSDKCIAFDVKGVAHKISLKVISQEDANSLKRALCPTE